MYVVQFQILRGLYNYANEALLLRRHTFTGTRASQREALLHGAQTTQEQPAAAALGEGINNILYGCEQRAGDQRAG